MNTIMVNFSIMQDIELAANTRRNNQKFIFFKKGPKLKKIDIENIIYLYVEERYCTVITAIEKFVIQISLTKIKDFFESYNFVKTHRNTMINANKIVEVNLQENTIILEGNYCVTLSDKYKEFLNQQIIF